MTTSEVIKELKKHYNPKNIEGMKRYGIKTDKAFGLNTPAMYAIAKRIGKNHELAQDLKLEVECVESFLIYSIYNFPLFFILTRDQPMLKIRQGSFMINYIVNLSVIVRTSFLLILSNMFMTFSWYGHYFFLLMLLFCF